MRKRTIALIVVVIIVLFVAIVGTQVYLQYTAAKSISVSVLKVGAQNVSISTATITVTLAFTNPTSTSLPPAQVSFSAYIAGKYIGNGSLPEVTIVGNNAVTQTLSFNVTYTSVAIAVINSLLKGDYNVTVAGHATVKVVASLIPITVGFTASQICTNLSAKNCTQTMSIS